MNRRHGWYHGPWAGYWGSSWYAPVFWGAAGWGLGSWASNWGYGAYYNPYYVVSAPTVYVPYDYSQPVAINYVTTDVATAPVETAEAPSPGMQTFDQGMALFKNGDYQGALNQFNNALRELPNDPVVHEVRALALFALGDYQQAAASLNSLLASAPGMDWTTMSSLYGNPADYTTQLRRLESFCKDNPNDAAAYFVLAYHYLVTGAKDAAANALSVVVKNQPRDVTARRMLDALVPPETVARPVEPEIPPTPSVNPPADANAPETDLVGSWKATAGGATIELTVTEDSQFTWKATPTGQPPVELHGELSIEDGEIMLDSDSQGSMAGSVTSEGPDKWRFNLTGAPANDPGLVFERVR